MTNVVELNDQITQFSRGWFDEQVFQAILKLRLSTFVLLVENFALSIMNSTER